MLKLLHLKQNFFPFNNSSTTRMTQHKRHNLLPAQTVWLLESLMARREGKPLPPKPGALQPMTSEQNSEMRKQTAFSRTQLLSYLRNRPKR